MRVSVPVSVAQAADRVTALLNKIDAKRPPQIINVTGPLGVGKSRLLATLSPRPLDPTGSTPIVADSIGTAPYVIDGVDSDRRAEAAARVLDRVGQGRFLIGSRLPLAARPGWAERPISTVEIAPWSLAEIRELVSAYAVVEPAQVDLVVRLCGGIPLIADSLRRALRGGVESGLSGALADAAATDVLRRLATEARRVVPDLLPVVATLDGADEDLLTALVRLPSSAFGRLRQLSVTRPDRHGLTVVEPYRTLFDLAYRWRRPVLRGDLAARGALLRHRQLSDTADVSLRARLADQILYLSARPQVRRDLFTTTSSELSVRRAHAGDEEAITRLVHRWAAQEELAPGRAERMRELWLSGTEHGFHLAVDADDRAVGMVNLTPVSPVGTPVLESLLQQHTESLLGVGSPGLVVGMMTVEPDFARAQPVLVRHILGMAVAAGRLVVSTSWTPYQQMSARFSLRRLGETRSDLYRCGRASAIYARTFTAENLPAWLRRMQGLRAVEPDPMVELVRSALQNVHSPTRLAASPLLARGGSRSPSALATLLRQTVEALASSASIIDAEAGQLLSLYYFAQAGGHDFLAHRLHLSRATYFRRLEYGVRSVADAVGRTLTEVDHRTAAEPR